MLKEYTKNRTQLSTWLSIKENKQNTKGIEHYLPIKDNMQNTKAIENNLSHTNIYRQNLKKIPLDSTIEVQLYVICPKLFIFRKFYFLILKSNVEPHHKYLSK